MAWGFLCWSYLPKDSHITLAWIDLVCMFLSGQGWRFLVTPVTSSRIMQNNGSKSPRYPHIRWSIAFFKPRMLITVAADENAPPIDRCWVCEAYAEASYISIPSQEYKRPAHPTSSKKCIGSQLKQSLVRFIWGGRGSECLRIMWNQGRAHHCATIFRSPLIKNSSCHVLSI